MVNLDSYKLAFKYHVKDPPLLLDDTMLVWIVIYLHLIKLANFSISS